MNGSANRLSRNARLNPPRLGPATGVLANGAPDCTNWPRGCAEARRTGRQVGRHVDGQNVSQLVGPVTAVAPLKLSTGSDLYVRQEPSTAVRFLDDHQGALSAQPSICPVGEAGGRECFLDDALNLASRAGKPVLPLRRLDCCGSPDSRDHYPVQLLVERS